MHLVAPQADLPSIEGVLIARRAGHYVVEVPRLITSPDHSHLLESRWVEIPQDRVAFYEVVG